MHTFILQWKHLNYPNLVGNVELWNDLNDIHPQFKIGQESNLKISE